MSMADAERLYAQWCQLNGPVTPMTVVDLISWVLMDERRRETTGHRQVTITDESYLLKLGYRHERDGWHLPDNHEPCRWCGHQEGGHWSGCARP